MSETRELFPVVWLGNDKEVPDQSSVRDFRPQRAPIQEPAVIERSVDEDPKASSATPVAESSSDESPDSPPENPAASADVAKAQTGQVSPATDLEAMMIGNS